jgi:hypothetical protein
VLRDVCFRGSSGHREKPNDKYLKTLKRDAMAGWRSSLLASRRCLSTKPRRYGKPRWLRLSWRDRYNIDELWYALPYPLV